MNCPKCNSKVKASKFNTITGYDSYRCENLLCNSLWDKKDLLSTSVFHVANPEISGKILKEINDSHYLVRFSTPVGFSGNPLAGKKTDWACSKSLLFSSSEKAKKNHNSNI